MNVWYQFKPFLIQYVYFHFFREERAYCQIYKIKNGKDADKKTSVITYTSARKTET